MQTFSQYLKESGSLSDYDYIARKHGYKKAGEHTTLTTDPKTGAGGFYGGGAHIHHYEHPTGKKFSVHEKGGTLSFLHGQKYGKTPNGLDQHLSSMKEGVEEHEKFKDPAQNPFHKTLTQHGFKPVSTKHEQNPFAKNNPKADSTYHRYEHPDHGKSNVIVQQEHDNTVGHGGQKAPVSSFVHRHEQSNGILSPSIGDTKPQLHRSLSSEYGVPKGMEAPKLTADEKKYPRFAPRYKMNDK